MKQKIIDFLLNEELETLDIKYSAPSDIIGIFESLYFEWNEEFITNGWEMDYFIEFTNDLRNQTISYSGSLYFGDAVLTKIKERE